MNCCQNQNDKKKEDHNLIPVQNNTQASTPDPAEEKTPSHNPLKHMLHMLVCCGLPILLILVLPAIGYKGVLLNIVPFICPIMMLLMIPMMMRGHGNSGESCHTQKKLAKEEESSSKTG